MAKPPIGQRRCPACGLPMSLVCIQPTHDAGEDERTFECGKCAYRETVIVKFRFSNQRRGLLWPAEQNQVQMTLLMKAHWSISA